MWHVESIAERGRAMRTFVCIVSETGRRVTTENGESLQRRERLCAGRSIRLFQRTRAKQAYVKGDLEGIMRGQHYCTCAFRRRQLSPFYPLSTLRHHVHYFGAQALCYPKPRGQRSRVTIARAEGLGTRLSAGIIRRQPSMLLTRPLCGCM